VSAESEAPPPKPPAPSAPPSTATDERNDKPETFPFPLPLDIRNIALTFLASVTAIGVLYIGRNLLVPILFGVGIAFLLSPAVDRLERWRIPRVLAAAVLLIALAAALGGIGYHVSGQATQLIGELPAAARKINDLLNRSTEGEPGSKVAQLQEAAEELTREAPETPRQAATRPVATPVRIVSPPPQVTDYLLTGSIGIAGMVAQVVLVLFLVFFSLASGDLFKLKLVRLTGPSLSQRKITVQIIDEIGQTISRYLRNLAFVCTIVGVATWLAFSALGVPNAALWGVLAAIANTVPYFGPTVVWVSATVAAYLHFDTVGMALLTGGTSLLITGLEGMLLTPTLMSRTAHMNTVAMFVGLLFWGWLWGFWGMVLAVPLLMTLKVIADRIEDLAPVGELLGD
jgi:predicted PurR-regulated permease PerM